MFNKVELDRDVVGAFFVTLGDGVLELLGWLWGLVVRTFETLFDTESYLAFEPLVTINAIGVAVALFALEQRVTLNKRRAESWVEAERRHLLRFALSAMLFSGFCHLISIVMILSDRKTCAGQCTADDENGTLAWATNITMAGTLLIVVAFIYSAYEIIRLRGASEEKPPSILA